MDSKSLEMLEFPKVRDIIAGETSFSVGRELALALQPHTRVDTITLLLKQSAESRHLLVIHPSASVGDVLDIRPAVQMAKAGRTLDPRDLVSVQRTLAATRNLGVMLEKVSSQVPTLWDIARGIANLPSVESDIATSLAPTGEVLDSASARLSDIRRRLRDARQELLGSLQGFISSSRGQKTIQEPIITERDGRYVIPIKVEHRKEVNGIVHDISNTGQTVFVEPLLAVELGNELRQLIIEEKQEIDRILSALSSRVGEVAAEISLNVNAAAQLDLAFAKARYADRVSAIEPLVMAPTAGNNISHRRIIRLVKARHPLLKGKVVPLSVELGGDNTVLVISGPNTGGKTVALKTIGLLALMAQAGIPVPVAEGTCLPVFDGVFADIGDEQSIEQTLSTFSWHIGNITRILRESTADSLVLLDELGASTDPNEGTALAKAILLCFRDRGTLAVATTHYNDIKLAARTYPGLQNASLDFDSDTLSPTYHLTIGVPGASNAMAIAAHLGMPTEIITSAKAMLSGSSLDMESIMRSLTLERQQIADLRARLDQANKEAEAERLAFLYETDETRKEVESALLEERAKVMKEAAELRKQIRVATVELRNTTSKKAVDRAKHAMAQFQRIISDQISADLPGHGTTLSLETDQDFHVGDRMTYGDGRVEGIVVAFNPASNEMELQVGNARLRVDAANLKRSAGEERMPLRNATVTPAAQARIASRELDLRGRRAEQVEPALDAYLNGAFLAQLPEVRVIHGLATGTVRQIVRDAVSTHPLVQSFRPGGKGEGGDGVTVVALALKG
ncbi:MAG: endonuclease MutS2 [Dehalococcoidia bacterium]|nr:endonuclease MutS2 [Dehalococcoidia bacterium]